MPFPKDPVKRQEAIEKIRLAAINQWKNPITRAKSKANNRGTTGKKYSIESRAKMSAWQIGRKMSKEARIKMSIAKKGDKSFYVVGDKRYYNPKVRVSNYCWSKGVRTRDNYTCQICQMTKAQLEKLGIQLEAHHIKSYHEFPRLRLDINNGLTVCTPCHDYIHKKDHALV